MNSKLTTKVRLGYGIGYVAGTLMADFIGAYFFFYLTYLAGVAPALAGTITMIGTIANAIANPIMGFYADKPGKKGSKKHRMIIKGIVAAAIIAVLMYTIWPQADGGFKAAYYIGLVIAYYFVYAAFEVPYYAIAPSLTDDTDERTKLASTQVTLSYGGSFIIGIVTPIMLDKLVYSGAVKQGFAMIGGFFAVLAVLCVTICYFSTKRITEERLANEEVESEEVSEKVTLSSFLELMKSKPLRIIMILTFTYYIFYNIVNATAYYFSAFYLNWSGSMIAIINGVLSILGALFAFLAGKLCVRFDKRNVLITVLLADAAFYLVFKVTGFFAPVFQVATWYPFDAFQGAVFWCLIYTLLYETIDIEEFSTGVRKEGKVMGVFTLVAVIGQSVAGQLVGILMQIGGLDTDALDNGTVTTIAESAREMLFNCMTLYTGILLVICAVVLLMYPVTRKKWDLFKVQYDKKLNGEAFNTEGFENFFTKKQRKELK